MRANARAWIGRARFTPLGEPYGKAAGVLSAAGDGMDPNVLFLEPGFWKRPDFAKFKGPPVLLLDGNVQLGDGGDADQVAALRDMAATRCMPDYERGPKACRGALLYTPTVVGGVGGLAVWNGDGRSPDLRGPGGMFGPPPPGIADAGWYRGCGRHAASGIGAPLPCKGRAPLEQLYLTPVSAEMEAVWRRGLPAETRTRAMALSPDKPRYMPQAARRPRDALAPRDAADMPVTGPMAGDMMVVVGTDLDPMPGRGNIARGGLSDAEVLARARANMDGWAEEAAISVYEGVAQPKLPGGPVAGLTLSPRFWDRAEFADYLGPPLVLFKDKSAWIADGGDPLALHTLGAVEGGCRLFPEPMMTCSEGALLFTPDGQGGLKVWGRLSEATTASFGRDRPALRADGTAHMTGGAGPGLPAGALTLVHQRADEGESFVGPLTPDLESGDGRRFVLMSVQGPNYDSGPVVLVAEVRVDCRTGGLVTRSAARYGRDGVLALGADFAGGGVEAPAGRWLLDAVCHDRVAKGPVFEGWAAALVHARAEKR